MLDQMETLPASETWASDHRMELIPVRPIAGVGRIILEPGRTVIGSDSSCDVVLNVGGIESRHCVIEVRDDTANVTALSCMTWINEAPVREQQLRAGDTIAIGPLEFTVEAQAASTELRPAPDGTSPTPFPSGFDDLLCNVGKSRRPAAWGPSPAEVPRSASTAAERSVSSKDVSRPDETVLTIREACEELARQEAKFTQTAQALAELEQRRGELQNILNQLRSEVSRSTNDRHEQHEQVESDRNQREDFLRLQNDVMALRAMLLDRTHEADGRRHDLDIRAAEPADATRAALPHESELQQAVADLARAKRDQFERERLLQARIEEVNAAESALIERQAQVRRQWDQLQERERELTVTDATSAHASPETARRLEELEKESRQWAQERRQLEAEVQRLRQAMETRNLEVERLRVELTADAEALDQRELELQHRESELDCVSAELASRLRDVESREHSAASSRQSYDSERTQIEEALNSLHAQRKSLAADRDALAAEQQTLKTRRTELEEQAAEVQRQRAALEQERSELEDACSQLEAAQEALLLERQEFLADQESVDQEVRETAERDQVLAESREQLRAREAELEQRLGDIKRWKLEVEQQQQASAATQEELAQRDAALCERERTLRERDETVATREAAVTARDQEVFAREAQVGAREEALIAQEEEIAERLASLGDLEEILAEQGQLDAERDKLNQDREELNRQAAEIEQQRAVLADEHSELEQACTAIEESHEKLQREREALVAQQQTLDDREQELTVREQSLEEDNVRRQFQESAQHEADREELEQLRAEVERLRSDLATAQDEFARQQSVLQEQQQAVESARAEADETETPFVEEVSECADQFEVEAASAAAMEDTYADEVVDENAAVETQANEASLELRSQMAALFGIHQGVFSSAAQTEHRDVDEDAREAGSHESPVSASAEVGSAAMTEPAQEEVSHDQSIAHGSVKRNPEQDPELEAGDPDPITSYMQGLLARSQRDPDATGSARPSPSRATANQQPHSDVVRSTSASARDTGRAEVESEQIDAEEPHRHQPPHIDPDLERKHINSFRELANLSARSAVAKHHSAALKSKFAFQGFLTAACLTSALVLVTSSMWNSNSYFSAGAMIAAVTVILIWEMLKTVSLMQQNAAHRRPKLMLVGDGEQSALPEATSPEPKLSDAAETDGSHPAASIADVDTDEDTQSGKNGPDAPSLLVNDEQSHESLT